MAKKKDPKVEESKVEEPEVEDLGLGKRSSVKLLHEMDLSTPVARIQSEVAELNAAFAVTFRMASQEYGRFVDHWTDEQVVDAHAAVEAIGKDLDAFADRILELRKRVRTTNATPADKG